MRLDSNQTIMKAVQKIQENDTCSTFETALTVKTYNTKDSDEHRKEQFTNLQFFMMKSYLFQIFNGTLKIY